MVKEPTVEYETLRNKRSGCFSSVSVQFQYCSVTVSVTPYIEMKVL